MYNSIDPETKILLDELRCTENAQHRISAAKQLIGLTDQPKRIAYLINAVLYDPDPNIREKVKGMLFELYGHELENIIRIEASDGVPLLMPWLIPCSANEPNGGPSGSEISFQEIDEFVTQNDIAGLHEALRYAPDKEYRRCAAKTLAVHHDPETPEMLAKSVLFDPDELVQQAAYESLYEVAGSQTAESLLETLGAEDTTQSEEWLLIPDESYEEDDLVEEKEEQTSLFGLDQSSYFRGLLALAQKDKNPKTRIKVIHKLTEIQNVRVNEVLAQICLYDEDSIVRKTAQEALEIRLGESTNEFLAHVRNDPYLGGYETEEELDADDEAEADEDLRPANEFTSQINSQPSVIIESSSFSPLIIVAGLFILGVILLIILK